MSYLPEPVNELTLEWLLRELNRISIGIDSAPLGTSIVTIDSNETLPERDQFVLVDATSGNLTITLPRPISRRIVTIKKINNGKRRIKEMLQMQNLHSQGHLQKMFRRNYRSFIII